MLSFGANSSFLEYIPFQKGLGCNKQTESQKLSLGNNGGNCQNYFTSLLKRGLLYKERIAPKGEQILSLKSSPLFRRSFRKFFHCRVDLFSEGTSENSFICTVDPFSEGAWRAVPQSKQEIAKVVSLVKHCGIHIFTRRIQPH